MINAKTALNNAMQSSHRASILKRYIEIHDNILRRIYDRIKYDSEAGFSFVKMYFNDFFYDLPQYYLDSIINHLKSLEFKVNILNGRTNDEIMMEIIW